MHSPTEACFSSESFMFLAPPKQAYAEYVRNTSTKQYMKDSMKDSMNWNVKSTFLAYLIQHLSNEVLRSAGGNASLTLWGFQRRTVSSCALACHWAKLRQEKIEVPTPPLAGFFGSKFLGPGVQGPRLRFW